MTNEKKLENQKGQETYKDQTWTLPDVDIDGKLLKHVPYIQQFQLSAPTYVTAQYWRLSKSNNLVNKDGNWQFSKVRWTLPGETEIGLIKDTSSGKVLGAADEAINSFVELEDKKGESNDRQKWLRGPSVHGWFRLQNCNSRQVLTAEGKTKTLITGKK